MYQLKIAAEDSRIYIMFLCELLIYLISNLISWSKQF